MSGRVKQGPPLNCVGSNQDHHGSKSGFENEIIEDKHPSMLVDSEQHVVARGLYFINCSYEGFWLTVDQTPIRLIDSGM